MRSSLLRQARNRSLALGLAAALALLAACSHSDGDFQQVEGRYFDQRQADAIVDHQTTEREIVERFGDAPAQASGPSGTTRMRYRSVQRRTSTSRRFLAHETYSQTIEQELEIHLEGGIVASHDHHRAVTESQSSP